MAFHLENDKHCFQQKLLLFMKLFFLYFSLNHIRIILHIYVFQRRHWINFYLLWESFGFFNFSSNCKTIQPSLLQEKRRGGGLDTPGWTDNRLPHQQASVRDAACLRWWSTAPELLREQCSNLFSSHILHVQHQQLSSPEVLGRFSHC